MIHQWKSSILMQMLYNIQKIVLKKCMNMILVLSELDVSGNEHDFLRFCVFIGNRRT